MDFALRVTAAMAVYFCSAGEYITLCCAQAFSESTSARRARATQLPRRSYDSGPPRAFAVSCDGHRTKESGDQRPRGLRRVRGESRAVARHPVPRSWSTKRGTYRRYRERGRTVSTLLPDDGFRFRAGKTRFESGVRPARRPNRIKHDYIM